MSDCSISIIVPVYNAQEWLEHCLASIASQDFESWQAILVDDGSMDGQGKYATDMLPLTAVSLWCIRRMPG